MSYDISAEKPPVPNVPPHTLQGFINSSGHATRTQWLVPRPMSPDVHEAVVHLALYSTPLFTATLMSNSQGLSEKFAAIMHRAGNPSHRSGAGSGGSTRARYEKTVPTQVRRAKGGPARSHSAIVLPTRASNKETDPNISILEKVGDSSALPFPNHNEYCDRNMMQLFKAFTFSKPDWRTQRRNSRSLKAKPGLLKSGFILPKNGFVRLKNRPALQKLEILR